MNIISFRITAYFNFTEARVKQCLSNVFSYVKFCNKNFFFLIQIDIQEKKIKLLFHDTAKIKFVQLHFLLFFTVINEA